MPPQPDAIPLPTCPWFDAYIYFHYQNDCANFVSQCLIAGKVKFRHCTGADDNITPTDGWEMWFPYYVNSKALRESASGKNAKFSRTISGAHYLYRSLLPNILYEDAHRGHFYPGPYDDPNNEVWSHVEPGDVIFQMNGGGGDAGHAMLIDEVDYWAKDLYICGHSYDRSHVLLSSIVPNWKTGTGGDEYRIVHLPDAPLIDQLYGIQVWSGGQPIKYKWREGAVNWKGAQWKEKAGNAELKIRIDFDCRMKTSSAASVRLLTGVFSSVSFVGVTDTGWYNGWRTGATNADGIQFRTWRGIISASNLPQKISKPLPVLVEAYSFHDEDENCEYTDLSKYSPGPNRCIWIFVDTTKNKGDKSSN